MYTLNQVEFWKRRLYNLIKIKMTLRMVRFMDRTFYPDYSNNWDDKLYRDYLLNFINSDTVVLDIGAGAGIVSEMNFRGIAKEIYGVDPDNRVKHNPYLDFSFIGLGDDMEFFEDNKFDVVFCDNVFEHVERPLPFLKEVNRVLKVGGRFISKTPNRNHYMSLIARFTPTSFHKFYNKLRGRQEVDTFPTYYKLNSRRQQAQLASKTNFAISEIRFLEGRPEYLRISAFTYLFGIAYERIVNNLSLDRYKILLIANWQKGL